MNVMRFCKRMYHPGFNRNRLLCLPICKENKESIYYKYVWGNKIQKEQLVNNKIGYETNKINYYSKKINNFFNNKTVYIPTSHNTPIKTALRSCRYINSEKFIKIIDKKIIDNDGIFINNKKNRKEIFKLLNYCDNDFEKKIIEGVIYGIISNYGDSIYIANDYLNISNYNIISNYPINVAQREVERCRSVAYSLLLGNYPIILNDKYDFEGEANIKFIPAIINNKGEEYQLCLTFESSRSNIKSIEMKRSSKVRRAKL